MQHMSSIRVFLYEKYSDDYKHKSTLLVRMKFYCIKSNAIKFIKNLSLKFVVIIIHLIQIKKKNGPELIELCKKKLIQNHLNQVWKSTKNWYLFTSLLQTFMRKRTQFYLKNIMNREQRSVLQRLTMMKFQRSVLQVIENYKSIKNESESDQNKGMNNIFIVGIPRSGTTLTESLITANNSIWCWRIDVVIRFIISVYS